MLIAALARPLPPMRALLWTAIACAAVAAYCLAYTALAGSSETLAQSLGWASSMIAPWLIAFEAQKRMTVWPAILAVLAAAMLLSLALGVLLLGQSADGFELVRRLPALLALAAIVVLIRTLDRRAAERAEPPAVDPVAVDWVRASGNYVEVHTAGRATVHRSTCRVVGPLAERPLHN